jgi:hypothetical protein
MPQGRISPMPDRPPAATPSEPIHAFKPTNGTAMGLLGVTLAVVVIALAAWTERSIFGLQLGLAAALVGVLAWMVLLRPRVRVYADTLVLRNMASDTYLPLVRVETVVVRHTLNVWVDDRRYTCPGIGRSTRSMMRAARSTGVDRGSGEDYQTFVETTILELADAARREQLPEPSLRREWAWFELGILAVVSVAFVVSLVL